MKAAGLIKDEVVKEYPSAMINRLFRGILNKPRILVINDEAHHCYREKPQDSRLIDEEKLTGEDRKEADENSKAARVWINGLEALSKKIAVNCRKYYMTSLLKIKILQE